MSNVDKTIGFPMAMLAELTHRCPLRCPYCSNPLALEKADSELSTEQWIDVMRQACDMGILQIHFSGGEPALRKDLEDLVAAATKLNLYTNLITSGINLDEDRIRNLAKLGLAHIQISIQDSEEQQSNKIGGHRNGHKLKLAAAKAIRKVGLPLTLNAPVHRMNIDHLESIIAMAVELDAARLEVAHVQYYGWAYHNRAALMPKRSQLEWATEVVEKARKDLHGVLVIDYVVPDYYAKKPKSCMGGWGRQFLNVTPSGKVLPCHAAESITDLEFDSVTEKSLLDIWKHSKAFEVYRGVAWMPEKCRACERHEIDWGGCRCQAFAITGNAANMDPACEFSDYHEHLVSLAEIDSSKQDVAFDYRRIGAFSDIDVKIVNDFR